MMRRSNSLSSRPDGDHCTLGEKAVLLFADIDLLLRAAPPLIIHLATAKALELTIPSTLLARADEAIE